MFEHKGLWAAVIVLLAIFGLSACGDGDEEPAATVSPTSVAPATGAVESPTTAVESPTTAASPVATASGPTATPAATPATAEPTPEPQPPTVTTLALDMDPYGGTANDDRTVGPIESCVSVAPGDTFDIDVVLDAIPSTVAGGNLAGFQYFMGFDVAALAFVGQSHTLAGTNLIVRAPDSCVGPLGCLDRTESVPEPPDSGAPLSPAVHDVLVADPAGPEGPEPTDPASHAGGVLGRYTIEANPEATPGVYSIDLDASTTYVPTLNDKGAGAIWDLPGDGIDNDSDGEVDEDLMLDATAGYGQVAIGVPCPEAPG